MSEKKEQKQKLSSLEIGKKYFFIVKEDNIYIEGIFKVIKNIEDKLYETNVLEMFDKKGIDDSKGVDIFIQHDFWDEDNLEIYETKEEFDKATIYKNI